MSLRRSIENESAITATNGYPLTAQTMASAIPVLPDVASTTVWPGFRVPRRSASSMMPIASRSLTEAIGLKASHFTYMVTFDGASRLIRTTGVLPMVPRMFSWSMNRLQCLDVGYSRNEVTPLLHPRRDSRGVRRSVGARRGGPAAHDARRLLPHGQRDRRAIQPRQGRRRAAAMARGAGDRRHEPRKVLLRGDRPGVEPDDLLARFRVDLRRVGDDRGGEDAEPYVPRVAALSDAGRARPGGVEEARREQRVPRGLVAPRRPREHVRRPLEAIPARAAPRDPEVRRSVGQGGLPDRGRRLHRRRAAEVREGRTPPRAHPVLVLAVQGATVGRQRVGSLSAVGGVRDFQAIHRRSPPLPRGRDL